MNITKKCYPIIACNKLIIADEDGYEVMVWNKKEWVDDPDVCVLVMLNAVHFCSKPNGLSKMCELDVIRIHYDLCKVGKPQWKEQVEQVKNA
jgi:hypothetical protein